MSHDELLLDAIRQAPRLLGVLRPLDEHQARQYQRSVRRGERLGWTTEQLSEALWHGWRAKWGYDFIDQVVEDLVRRGVLVQAGGRVKLRPTRRGRRR